MIAIDEAVEVLEFTIVPTYEKYYSEDTSWGIFNFTTKDDIPHSILYNDPFAMDKLPQKMSSVVGKMQKLYLGAEYKVQAICEYNNKYSSYQYKPLSIVAVAPKTFEAQNLFLKSLATEYIANNILNEYPNVVEQVINGELIDLEYSKIKGLGKPTWTKIRNSIIDNYVISDIIVMLQPLGVTYNMIKKLLSNEPNPVLLKEQLQKNPYIMTKIRGLGFKRVDDLALKLKPELKVSMHRLTAFVDYFLHEVGENNGHTWIENSVLQSCVSDNVPECIELLPQLLSCNSFIYQENGRIGLKHYQQIEKNIFDILIEKTSFQNDRFHFTEEEISKSIKSVEDEQGFEYTDGQRETIIGAVLKDVSVISGKAGTGKTSIAKAIFRIYHDKEYSVTACALSAKAAQRISEATGYGASTIHRTLGAQGLNEFVYNHDNPLKTDVVFLDEASMVNAKLFYDLLCAIGIGTRLIISGDHRQLPPIGYGNIFSDILGRKDMFNSMQLTKPMRQAELSGILSDANLICDGVNPIKSPELKIVHGELNDMYYMFRESREALRNIAVNTYLKSIVSDGLDEVIIATPRRDETINSALEINKIIQDKLLCNDEKCIDKGWIKYKLGAKVIQTVNDYERNVFNGEIGYVTSIFDDYQGNKKVEYCNITYKNLDGSDKVILYTKAELDQISLAYALTVHKLQGSGYKTVIGIIDNTCYTLLDNCMLYTMITRAKKRCLLLAEPSAFLKCIRTNHNKRQTWIPDLQKTPDVWQE